ncbi:MAG: hypothetical protein ACM336_09870 [Acidobacteriota bacterium]
MKPRKLALVFYVLPLVASAQSNLVVGRVVGQNTLVMQSSAPNIVEGREMTNPQGVALDTSVSPPALYVSDTFNNRVLVWRDSSAFQNGAYADLVIGQKDKISTAAGGPVNAQSQTKGLNQPTGLALDAEGNLYVADSGNNRILRYPKPLQQPDPYGADLVIGQPDFTTRAANQGGRSASSLSLASGSTALRTSLAFDASGNLWVTDAGNHRVLRYPADSASGSIATTANLVVGQPDFTTAASTTAINSMDHLNLPSGIAFDSSGNLYVSDRLPRVLVFAAPLSTGQAAKTMLGGVLSGNQAPNPPTAQSLNSPESVTINPGTDEILVSDTFNNRVLKFPKLSQWPATGPPSASLSIGQPSFTTNKAGVSDSLLSAPVHVAATATELFIADSLNNRVVVVPQGQKVATRVLGQLTMNYNAPNLIEGRELYEVGLLPISATQFYPVPGGVAVDTTGAVPHLYIADPGNHRVLGYCDARKAKQGDKADLVVGQPDLFTATANGDGGTTPNDRNLRFPSGVLVDAKGDLYVADTGNGRVVRFAAPCSQPAAQQSFPKANLVIGQANFTSHTTDAGPRTMNAPYGLAIISGDTKDYLLVSDILQNRVLKFERLHGGDFTNGSDATWVFGQPDFYTTSSGTGNNRLNSPRHLATDGTRLYIADFNNNRFLVVSDLENSNPSPSLIVRTAESENRTLSGPNGIAVNQATGEIWVAPANDARVLKYPTYNTLALTPLSTAQTATATGPLALALDAHGTLYVAERGNRVSEYFPEVIPVNGASFLQDRPLAPGVIATAWAKRASTPATHAPSVPLPTELAGVQVLVGGTPAPLFYVGDDRSFPGYVQVNFQVPHNAPSDKPIDMQVIDAVTQQVLGAGALAMNKAAPAFFVTNSTTGQVAAFNVDPNTKARTCNGTASPCRPAKRGEILELYLTGEGYQSGWTKDGEAPAGGVPNDRDNDHNQLLVLLGTDFVDCDTRVGTRCPAGSNAKFIEYSGAAPGFVGLWQINVRVPNDIVAPGLPNPIAVVYRDISSMIGGTPKTIVYIQ